MKKAFVLLACLFAMQLTVSADDGTPIEVKPAGKGAAISESLFPG